MKTAFENISKNKYEGRNPKIRWPSHYNPAEVRRRQNHVRDLRFSVVYWQTCPQRAFPIRSGWHGVRRGTNGSNRWPMPKSRAGPGSSSSKTRRAVSMPFMTRHRAEGQTLTRRTKISTPCQGPESGTEAQPASSCSGARPTCFSNPRFVHGAVHELQCPTRSPFAGAQVKKALGSHP